MRYFVRYDVISIGDDCVLRAGHVVMTVSPADLNVRHDI
jgi:hypothetical protein